jgi:hypothetical protein
MAGNDSDEPRDSLGFFHRQDAKVAKVDWMSGSMHFSWRSWRLGGEFLKFLAFPHPTTGFWCLKLPPMGSSEPKHLTVEPFHRTSKSFHRTSKSFNRTPEPFNRTAQPL